MGWLYCCKSSQCPADSITSKFQTISGRNISIWTVYWELHAIDFHCWAAPIRVMCRWTSTSVNIVYNYPYSQKEVVLQFTHFQELNMLTQNKRSRSIDSADCSRFWTRNWYTLCEEHSSAYPHCLCSPCEWMLTWMNVCGVICIHLWVGMHANLWQWG